MAEVNWQLQFGGMYLKQYGTDVDHQLNNPYELTKGSSYELKGALLLQIPVSNSVPAFIETGLAYRNKLTISQEKGNKFDPEYILENYDNYSEFEFYRNNILELPIKAGYKLALNEKNSFNFGFGPYVGMCTERGFGDPISVGLNLSAAFRHRCMSFGLEWQNPLFLNGPRDYYKNSINLTIGINFKGKVWSHIGAATLATVAVAGGVATAYADSNGNSSQDRDYFNIQNNQYNGSDTQNSNSTSSSTSNSFYQQEYTRWQRVAERHYDSLTNLGYSVKESDGKKKGGTLQSMSSSNYVRMKKAFREAQKEMKKIRTKANKEGIIIQKSPIEDATVKY